MFIGQILLIQAILAVCVVLGWFFGRRMHKFADKRFTGGDLSGRELGRLTDTLSFVSGAVGILLGLLLSFAVAQFNETQSNIQEMGQSSIAVFTAATSFDTEEAFTIQREVVCLLRSTATDDWAAIGSGQMGGSVNTTQQVLALNQTITNVNLTSAQDEQAYLGLIDAASRMTIAREALVMGSTAMIPIVVWIVIFFSSFVMTALLAMHLADRKSLAVISAGMSWGMLAVILFALTVLDSPLSPLFGSPSLEPQALTSALDILQESVPTAALWAPCAPPQ